MAVISRSGETTAPVAAARRLRLYTIGAIALVSLLLLLTTTQTWWTIRLSGRTLPITGTVAGPALAALALCGLVLAAALALAGPVFRLLLGLLQLLLSATIVLTTILSLVHPQQPSEAAVQTATGIAGSASIDRLIKSVTETPWGFVAVALGVLAFLLGIWLLATFRLWPAATRKYQAVRFQAADGARDAVVDWDALSDGSDPTAGAGPTSPSEPVK